MASYNRVPWGPIMSNWEAERAERNRRSIARLTNHCQVFFHRRSCLGRSVVRSCHRRLGLPSTRIGAPIHFAPTGLRVPSLRGAEYLPAGGGGSEVAARMGCRPHSERHRPLIGNAHTRKARDSVAYAGNQFIASAGMPTFGAPVPTRMRPGIAPVPSHGNSGLRQVITSGS